MLWYDYEKDGGVLGAMIISASRRTDIPSYFSDWFFDRIAEGFVHVRNPMNFKQVSKIDLTPTAVDGIVFWTKNPIPMLDRLEELNSYMYYFHFTITPYGKDIEPKLPSKNALIKAFQYLSDRIDTDRVIWRYDPILINSKYTVDYHIHAFGKIADALHPYTKKVVISFIDTDYKSVKRNIKALALSNFSEEMKIRLAIKIAEIANNYGLTIEACATPLNLAEYDINPSRCIDSSLFSKLLGYELGIKKDKGQRPECGCAVSRDIGSYNTCENGCMYCYANYL